MNMNATTLKTILRDGSVVSFDAEKIRVAITATFMKDGNGQPRHSEMGTAIREAIADVTTSVVSTCERRGREMGSIHIEDIQDQVELTLMRRGFHVEARDYVLFRARKAEIRKQSAPAQDERRITLSSGAVITESSLAATLNTLKGDLNVDVNAVAHQAIRELFEGIDDAKADVAALIAARSKVEDEPDYSKLTARILLKQLAQEVAGGPVDLNKTYPALFKAAIQKGIKAELLDRELSMFDLERLASAIKPERDGQFDYLGLQTLYDRYFLHVDGTRIELPQVFLMRVAMGLAIRENDREARAIEFYDVLSSFDFMSSTPTLFNSGTRHSQLSSCYLTTIADALDGIYDGIKENALLSKFAGGLGNDWTPVRALGSHIKGTNGKSQGVVPFLKVVNDTAVAVNQGGKRKGAVCAYLESWHLDIEEFLELRKNTGDDRRRTHDMNTANWIPDLFMKRVMEDGQWTLFTPNEVPDLHDLYGAEFEKAYVAYEAAAERGDIKLSKKIPAVQLWRKMLTMLFETGHPWFTFKDPCNIRSPQQHMGVVHSSNLCTEITLNTSDDEIAVCNLGSINLVNHLVRNAGGVLVLDREKLARTARVAVRMLDNVIDINFYPVAKARNANMRHRPIGLGIMGFQDALQAQGIAYASEEAVAFADYSMEVVAHEAYLSSTYLAEEKGTYPSYQGSLWSRGILPQDSIDLLASTRGHYLDMDRSSRLDWTNVRERIARFGMRNSNVLAIAPTATIANIVGVSASIEPAFQNLFVKSNLSGEFTVVNERLVRDLKKLGIWDEVMVMDIKSFDGSIAQIQRIPDELKRLYATAFEIDPSWLIECASRRQKWIDQAQSLNIYMAGASGKKLDETYKLAWVKGLKTTYYLRTKSASSAEKSTGQGGELNAVSAHLPATQTEPKFCSLDNPECESCQ